MTDMKKPVKCCSNCKFWKQSFLHDESGLSGFCRRPAPSPSLWGITRHNEVCGEWEFGSEGELEVWEPTPEERKKLMPPWNEEQ